MAKFIEPDEELNESELEQEEELGTLDTEDSTEEVEQTDGSEDVQDKQEEDDVPPQYRGKSIAEVIQMHKEAEKAMSRQGNEVGELRKLVDDFIKSNLDKSPTQKAVVDDEDYDIFDKPDEWLEKKLSKKEQERQEREQAIAQKEAELRDKLTENFPDWQDTVHNDADFAKWVLNSKMRKRMFEQAQYNLDYDAAEELLSSWNEIKQVKDNTNEIAKEDSKKQRNKASTGTSKGTSEAKSKKVYRRSDIINLMQNDPARYEELSPEIMKAYAEGRVR